MAVGILARRVQPLVARHGALQMGQCATRIALLSSSETKLKLLRGFSFVGSGTLAGPFRIRRGPEHQGAQHQGGRNS